MCNIQQPDPCRLTSPHPALPLPLLFELNPMQDILLDRRQVYRKLSVRGCVFVGACMFVHGIMGEGCTWGKGCAGILCLATPLLLFFQPSPASHLPLSLVHVPNPNNALTLVVLPTLSPLTHTFPVQESGIPVPNHIIVDRDSLPEGISDPRELSTSHPTRRHLL